MWRVWSLLLPPHRLLAALAANLMVPFLPTRSQLPCPLPPVTQLVLAVLVVAGVILGLLRLPTLPIPLWMVLTAILCRLPSSTRRLIWLPIVGVDPVAVMRAAFNVWCV
jgi:hypothetical protein